MYNYVSISDTYKGKEEIKSIAHKINSKIIAKSINRLFHQIIWRIKITIKLTVRPISININKYLMNHTNISRIIPNNS